MKRFSLNVTRRHWLVGLVLGTIGWSSTNSIAQITEPRSLSGSVDPLASLEEQLVNRLHATADDQKAYLHFLVNKVREGKLETKLVIAVQQYAIKRHQQLPFLFFERAMKVEAGKRGVPLPAVRQFATVSNQRAF